MGERVKTRKPPKRCNLFQTNLVYHIIPGFTRANQTNSLAFVQFLCYNENHFRKDVKAMSQVLPKNQKNQSMDLCKLFASMMVLHIHASFPGRAGEALCLIGRFAVPMFLAITGFFNWGADCKTVARRLRHILLLIIVSSGFYAVFNAILAVSQGNPFWDVISWEIVRPGLPAIGKWIIFQLNPFSEHLWYLSAALLCYGLLWVYVSFWGEKKVDYRPVYLIGLFFGVLLFYSSVLQPWTGTHIHPHEYRNGWLTGIPMFTLGLFLREYGSVIRKNFHLTDTVLILLMVFSLGLALFEWRCGFAGEMTLGHLILTPILMLFLISHPQLPIQNSALNWMIGQIRSLSTGIYILHCAVVKVYDSFIHPWTTAFLYEQEAWLRPLFVLLLSIPVAMLWNLGESQIRKWSSQKKSL